MCDWAANPTKLYMGTHELRSLSFYDTSIFQICVLYLLKVRGIFIPEHVSIFTVVWLKRKE